MLGLTHPLEKLRLCPGAGAFERGLQVISYGLPADAELFGNRPNVVIHEQRYHLALARPEVKEKFPRLWAGRHVTEVPLGELSRKACERVVREVLGDVQPDVVARVVDRAGGNAFFLEELIRAVAAGQVALPDTVIATVQARLGALAPEQRRVLRAASVFGDVFSRGGLAALNVAANSFEVGYSTLGIRAAGIVPIGDGMVLIPRASAAWQHAFDGVTPDARLAFAASGVPFTIAGVPIARDSLLAEAGLDLAIGRNATVGVSYVGQLASHVQDHAAKGKFSWKF